MKLNEGEPEENVRQELEASFKQIPHGEHWGRWPERN
jgi:hypothetical protein